MKTDRKNGVFTAIRMAAASHPLLTAGTLLCVAASVGASLLPPLLLAMILEPIAEANFRRALSISQNDYAIFYTSPVACIVLGLSLFVLVKSVYDDIRASRKNPRQS